MKKKVVFLLLIVVVGVMALAGCTYRVYDRYLTFDELKTAMPNMILPDVQSISELKDVKFFNARDHKDEVSIDPKLKKNTIQILYVPPVEKGSQKEADDFQISEIKGADKLAYRYCMTMTIDKADKGVIEIGIYGTDYAKIKDSQDVKPEGKKPRTPEKRLEELKKIDKTFIKDKCSVKDGIMTYAKKDNELYQSKRYFAQGEGYSYELTATVTVKDSVEKKDAMFNELGKRADEILDELLASMLVKA